MNSSSEKANSSVSGILADRSSGAAEILQSAVDAFATLDDQTTVRQVIDLCVSLIHAQPSMAPLLNLASSVVGAVTAVGDTHSAAAAKNAAAAFARNAAERARAAAACAAQLIGEGRTVLTHSRSSTVLAALIEASKQGRRFSVIATESRPLLEGRTLARQLASNSINVTVIADVAAASVLDRVSFVLVGADRLTALYTTNKIGTRMIALAARAERVPSFVVCDTSKFMSSTGTQPEREREGEELWGDAPVGVSLLNRYFESTALDLFAAVLTEQGKLDIESARRFAGTLELHPRLQELLSEAACEHSWGPESDSSQNQ